MKIHFYQPTATSLWYWRIVARNGKTIADGAEGYSKRGNVLRACKKMQKAMQPGVPILELK